MSGTPRCDSCEKPIRAAHHETHLLDAETEQSLGTYHSACQAAALHYLTGRPGGRFILRTLHPERCGPGLRRCDSGVTERVA
jgi:hypothetical protein